MDIYSLYNHIVNSQALLSPGDNCKSQNKILGFVVNTACPLSLEDGSKVVTGF